MFLNRVGAVCALILAAVALSGCFVISANRVDGTGVDADPALAGTWRGLDDAGKIDKAVFLHVIAHKSGEGLRMALIDKDNIMLIDGTTVQAGPNRYLNATLQELPGLKPEDREILGTHIVRYEVKAKKLTLWLLDPTEISRAIDEKKIKGKVEGSGMTKSVKLTATPEELNVFLSKSDAGKYFQDKAITLVRFDK